MFNQARNNREDSLLTNSRLKVNRFRRVIKTHKEKEMKRCKVNNLKVQLIMIRLLKR